MNYGAAAELTAFGLLPMAAPADNGNLAYGGSTKTECCNKQAEGDWLALISTGFIFISATDYSCNRSGGRCSPDSFICLVLFFFFAVIAVDLHQVGAALVQLGR